MGRARSGYPPVSSVFDQWRAAYSELTPAGHALVAELMAMVWPRQQHYDERAVRKFLHDCAPRTVVEFGGYDGALAAAMLPGFPRIESWVNHDIVAVPQVCSDKRYRLGALTHADAMIASHSFEHVSTTEAFEAIRAVRPRALFVDAPLPQSGSVDWSGYQGTHILPLSWSEFDSYVRLNGYTESARWNTNKSHARAYRSAT